MSHPPETSRELTEQIRKILGIEIYNLETNEPWREIAALIGAWVRVREAEVRWDEGEEIRMVVSMNTDAGLHDWLRRHVDDLETALATARKQLEEKVP